MCCTCFRFRHYFRYRYSDLYVFHELFVLVASYAKAAYL